jgi:tol-pal system protein YbgF
MGQMQHTFLFSSQGILSKMWGRLLGIASLLLTLLVTPTFAQDATELLVRVNRLEGQVRTLSGQIEQAQFENRRLQEQLKRFQEDVEFRFQDQKGGARSGANNNSPARPNAVPSPAPTTSSPPVQRRGDAYDPTTAPQNNPQMGTAPRNLNAPITAPSGVRSGASGALIDEDGFEEMGDLGGRAPRGEGALSPSGLSAPYNTPQNIIPQSNTPSGYAPRSQAPVAPAPVATIPQPAQVPVDANQMYEMAYASLLQKQYDAAAQGFSQFLQVHPRHTLAPDATFWQGESYAQKGRHREAAERFLKVTSDYPKAAKAPDAMLKLGISLNALGAKDQACATLAKAERDYASKGDAYRQRVDKEQKRIKCA